MEKPSIFLSLRELTRYFREREAVAKPDLMGWSCTDFQCNLSSFCTSIRGRITFPLVQNIPNVIKIKSNYVPFAEFYAYLYLGFVDKKLNLTLAIK